MSVANINQGDVKFTIEKVTLQLVSLTGTCKAIQMSIFTWARHFESRLDKVYQKYQQHKIK